MVAQECHLSGMGGRERGSQQVGGQLGLHSQFWASQEYIEKPHLKQRNKQNGTFYVT